eukprot:1152579-Pelagomonas_calceolata.AAC.8
MWRMCMEVSNPTNKQWHGGCNGVLPPPVSAEIQEQWTPWQGAGGISEPQPHVAGVLDISHTQAALSGWHAKV